MEIVRLSGGRAILRASSEVDATIEECAAWEMGKMSRENVKLHLKFGGRERDMLREVSAERQIQTLCMHVQLANPPAYHRTTTTASSALSSISAYPDSDPGIFSRAASGNGRGGTR